MKTEKKQKGGQKKSRRIHTKRQKGGPKKSPFGGTPKKITEEYGIIAKSMPIFGVYMGIREKRTVFISFIDKVAILWQKNGIEC